MLKTKCTTCPAFNAGADAHQGSIHFDLHLALNEFVSYQFLSIVDNENLVVDHDNMPAYVFIPLL